MLPVMYGDQPYIVGVAHALEAAGLEKTAISRWLASKFGLGVGTAIDKTEEAITDTPPLEELAVPEPPELPSLEQPVIGDDIIDTPEEVEAAIVQVLSEVGVEPIT